MHPPNRGRSFLRQGLLAALLVSAVAVPAAAARLQLPPIIQPASHELHVGKVIFVELVTPDLAAAKRFYGGLFGWTFRNINAGRAAYAEAMIDGDPVGGLFQRKLPANEHRQSAWLTYFSVRDVDAATETALHNGAKLLFKPHSFPDRGREAVLADPQGAIFAVLTSSSGDPPDFLADPGAWIWSSLITSDPDTDVGFYQKIFGYDVFELPSKGSTHHFMLASGGYARASVNSLPPNRPDVLPHWLNYVRVQDMAAMVAKVVALGGRVLVPPRVERGGGEIALVADPMGAPFGLLQWPNTEGKEAPK
ncbi:MAG: VOC family protein [Acetobacteraceae bacterium]